MNTIPTFVWAAVAVAIVLAAIGGAAAALLAGLNMRRVLRQHDREMEQESREFEKRFKRTQDEIERGARPAGSKGFKL